MPVVFSREPERRHGAVIILESILPIEKVHNGSRLSQLIYGSRAGLAPHGVVTPSRTEAGPGRAAMFRNGGFSHRK